MAPLPPLPCADYSSFFNCFAYRFHFFFQDFFTSFLLHLHVASTYCLVPDLVSFSSLQNYSIVGFFSLRGSMSVCFYDFLIHCLAFSECFLSCGLCFFFAPNFVPSSARVRPGLPDDICSCYPWTFEVSEASFLFVFATLVNERLLLLVPTGDESSDNIILHLLSGHSVVSRQ